MKTRIFTLIVSLFITAMAFAYDYDTQIDGIYYNLDTENKTAEVTYGYGKYSGNITIPATILRNGETYRVTSIGESAFSYCSSLTSISIPNSVTGGGAFAYCSSLTSISIPNSVTSIGSSAFTYCSSLTSISIPNSVTEISNGAFSDCDALTSITIPNSVTSIGSGAFGGCSSLTSISIPNSVTSIGGGAFRSCPSLTSITIPNSVTSIGDETFKYCSSLTSISIPNSVTSIGKYAFSNCSTLTSISIGSNVTSIGERVFDGCPTLSSVQWNVKKYNDFSENNTPFNDRKSSYEDYNIKGQITSFTFGDSVEYIPAYLCHNMGKLTSITIPNSVTSIGECAFRNCSALTSISFGSNVTSIGESAFGSCSSLTSITIPNSVTSIGDGTFSGCSSLTSISIPNSVTSIGEYAFRNCSTLTSITIPNSVTSIGDEAFRICSSLTSITIPNSVTSIGDAAFYFCGKLRNIEIGNSIESIGNEAFRGCSGIYSLKIGTMIPPIVSATTFTDVSRTMQIKVPCGSITAYQSSSYWNEFTNYIESPYTLTVNVNDATMGVAVITKQATCSDVTAQVQAQAKPGYKFVGWSDGFTENPHTIFATEDMTLTAEFAKEGEEPGENPDVEKHNNFIVESADATQGSVIITITAQAIEGFEFSHWSDGSTENPRNVTLDKDVELYAHFQVKGTGLENSVISSADVYSRDGRLHVEGAENDYYVLDMAGRLIYSGRDTELQLPRGVYVVNVGGEVQKIVL